MYKFKWEEIITDNLIAELSNITGIVLEIKNERITSLLTSIFKAIGGLPISKIDLSEDEKTTLAIQLLSEALSRYLFDVGKLWLYEFKRSIGTSDGFSCRLSN